MPRRRWATKNRDAPLNALATILYSKRDRRSHWWNDEVNKERTRKSNVCVCVCVYMYICIYKRAPLQIFLIKFQMAAVLSAPRSVCLERLVKEFQHEENEKRSAIVYRPNKISKMAREKVQYNIRRKKKIKKKLYAINDWVTLRTPNQHFPSWIMFGYRLLLEVKKKMTICLYV